MNQPEPVSRTLKVGEWQLETATNRLFREGEEVILTPKIMATLLAFCEQPNRPLSHEQLLAWIWPDQIVSDSSLYQAIAQLRKALADQNTPRRYIERVSGKAYRLIAPVSEIIPAETIPAGPATTIPTKYPYSLWDLWSNFNKRFSIIAAMFCGAILFAYWAWIASQKPESALPQNLTNLTQWQSVAIASFTLLTEHSASQRQYWANGLTDTLLTRLASVPTLRVVSTPSVDPAEVEKMRHEHAVDGIITGQIQNNGTHLRVTVQLLAGERWEVQWSRIFDGDADHLFDLQDQIALALLAVLQPSATRNTSGTPISAAEAPDSEAFDHYLLGRFHWAKRNARDLQRAVDFFQQAIQHDSDFALAYVGLCDTYNFLSLYADWTTEQATQACAPLLQKALWLAPDLGQAHAAFGLLSIQSGDHAAAEQAFQRALALTPNYAPAYLWYGFLKRNQGHIKQALQLHRHAFELEPYSPNVNRNLAFSLLNNGEFHRARQIYQRALKLEPHYVYRPVDQLDFLPLTVDTAREFLLWAKQHPNLLDRIATNRISLAAVMLALGQPQHAAKHLREAEKLAPQHQFLRYIQGVYYVHEGKLEQALSTFQKRLRLNSKRASFAIPIIALLDKLERNTEAWPLLQRHYPILAAGQAPSINTSNHIEFLLLWLIFNDNKKPELQKLEENLQSYLSQHFDAGNPNHLAWQGLYQAQTIAPQLEALLDQGWLPNTNDTLWKPEHDPLWQTLSHHERQRLLKKLAVNRLQALEVIAKEY